MEGENEQIQDSIIKTVQEGIQEAKRDLAQRIEVAFGHQDTVNGMELAQVINEWAAA